MCRRQPGRPEPSRRRVATGRLLLRSALSRSPRPAVRPGPRTTLVGASLLHLVPRDHAVAVGVEAFELEIRVPVDLVPRDHAVAIGVGPLKHLLRAGTLLAGSGRRLELL